MKLPRDFVDLLRAFAARQVLGESIGPDRRSIQLGHRRTTAALLSILCSVALVMGCASSADRTTPSAAVGPDTDLWNLPSLGPIEHGWIAPGCDLTTYEVVWIEPLRTRSDPIDPSELSRMQASLEALLRQSGKRIDRGGLRVSVTAYSEMRRLFDASGGPTGLYRPSSGTFPVVALDFEIVDDRGVRPWPGDITTSSARILRGSP
jgi:hypothetical protein